MKRVLVIQTVQYVPGAASVLIPLQEVSPNAAMPLVACNAPQEALVALTPTTLSDRSRWSDREIKAYATAFARQNEPDAEVYFADEWTALKSQETALTSNDAAILQSAQAIVAAS